MNTKSKSFKEIEDLINAYQFANKPELNISHFLKAHSVLSKTLISESKFRGKIRDKAVYVFGEGVKVYTGAAHETVTNELNSLFSDIDILLKGELSVSEVLYFASMIHLVLAKIHPFADGKGRSARLIGKWFLAQKLGDKAWVIQSEKLYQTRLQSYFKNIDIGSDFKTNDFDLSIPFLLMLPMALTMNK